jgi:hypothetical protein
MFDKSLYEVGGTQRYKRLLGSESLHVWLQIHIIYARSLFLFYLFYHYLQL